MNFNIPRGVYFAYDSINSILVVPTTTLDLVILKIKHSQYSHIRTITNLEPGGNLNVYFLPTKDNKKLLAINSNGAKIYNL